MTEIATLVTSLVNKARNSSPNTLKGDGAILGVQCPQCNEIGSLTGAYRAFKCSKDCGFQIPRFKMGRNLTNEELEKVIHDKRVGPLHGFRTRMGKEYSTSLVLVFDEKVKTWVLSPEFQERDPAPESIDLSGKEELGNCPCCKGKVFIFENHYACINSKATASKEASCKFRVSKEILKQEITSTQIKQLMETGKTEQLTGFISQRTNKPFAAKLIWDKKNQRSSFEFEPRKEKPSKFKK